MPLRTQVSFFQLVAILEAISWAGLLTGMYFKYLTDAGELGVKIFGPIHGGVFIAYVLATVLVSRTLRWSTRTTLTGLVCSLPPFATLVFEIWASRSGRLTARTDVPLSARDDVHLAPAGNDANRRVASPISAERQSVGNLPAPPQELS